MRNYSKWRDRIIKLEAEDDIEEVKEVILVVEAEDKKERKNNPTNKIGTKGDEKPN